jgi:hypothetical protein
MQILLVAVALALLFGVKAGATFIVGMFILGTVFAVAIVGLLIWTVKNDDL